MFSLSRSLTVAAVASLAAAQGFSLTSQCTATLASIATNPDAGACLKPSPLLGVLGAGNSSIITPIDNWLTGLCAAPACSNNTIAAIMTNVTAGCPTEAALLGIKADDVSAVIPLVQQFYPTVRQVVCLKDGNTNCVTKTLTDIQQYTGPLTISNIISIAGGSVANLNIPENITCTNCIKAAYNIISKVDSNYLSNGAVKQTCGDSFVDGKTPDGIVQTASGSTQNSASSTGNGNSGLAVTYNAASALSALLFTFGGFAVLA